MFRLFLRRKPECGRSLKVLGGGLEPPRLTAYAPQTYVSAISPPERFGGTKLLSRTMLPASVSWEEMGSELRTQNSELRTQESGVSRGARRRKPM